MSALMNVRRQRAAAGQLCEAHSLVAPNIYEASFVRGGSYRFHEDAHLGRLKIVSASVSDTGGALSKRCSDTKFEPNEDFTNSMILSKIVFNVKASRRASRARTGLHKIFANAYLYSIKVPMIIASQKPKKITLAALHSQTPTHVNPISTTGNASR